MNDDKRKQEGCPTHQLHWLYKEGNTLRCAAFGCEWKITAKRSLDKEIRTFKEIQDAFNN